MTSRERILAVLKGRTPDRIPWSPLIDGYYLAGLRGKPTDIDAGLDVGADVMVRKIPVWERSVFFPHEVPGKSGDEADLIEPRAGISRKRELQDDEIVCRYETPYGSLTDRWRLKETSPYIPFPAEYLIKEPADLRAYMHLVEKEEFLPRYDIFESLDLKLGDEGIVTTVIPHTPVQHLLLIHMGVETFYYMLSDHREEMIEVMNLMHERHKELSRIIANSPAEVGVQYENTGTTYISPKVCAEFEMPPMNDYADILHSGQKTFLVHMCGRLSGLAKPIAGGRQDGCIDLAPPPTGDWQLADALRAWPDKIVGGGLDSITLKTGTRSEVIRHTRKVLQSIAPGDRVILGNGDAILMGTPPDNLRAVTETVEEHGTYPLPHGHG
jgi:uroporphyrinogen-III decarboxylase